MVIYKCITCNKIFNHKNDFKKHLDRKNACTKTNNGNETIAQNQKIYLTCQECGKIFNSQYNLNKHICYNQEIEKDVSQINRKTTPKLNPSKNVYLYDSKLSKSQQMIVNKMKNNLVQGSTYKNSEYSEKVETDTNSEFTSVNNIEEIDNNMGVISKRMIVEIYKCYYCDKKFGRYDSLNRHITNSCKIKNQIEEEKEKIFKYLVTEMDKKNNEINELKKTTEQIRSEIKKVKYIDNRKIINNTQNNYTNNIKLVAFGQEDLSYISDQICSKILNKGFQAVPKLVEYVHFNKETPEFHNVYISNMRDNYAMIYDGKKWKLNDRTETIDTLIDTKKDFLIEKFKELLSTLDENTIKKFKRFLEQQDNREIVISLIREIKFILYNNKNIPEETRKLLWDELGLCSTDDDDIQYIEA